MQLTRRGWELAGIVVVLVGLAVLAQQPLALYLGAGVAAFGLAQQYSAMRALLTTDEALSITYTVAGHSAVVDEPVQLTLLAELSEPCSTTVEIEPSLPVAATRAKGSSGGDPERIHLRPGDTTAQMTIACSFPVAGEFTVPKPMVRLTDRTGRIRETLRRGPQPTVIVESRTPQQVHVGQGGAAVTAYGEHQAAQHGAGTTPAELRQYVPGDTLRRIDWKATARLGEPHVREFEADTDRETVLVVDARSSMTTGLADRTMLDYVRKVALGIVALTERNDDPLGCYIIGEDSLSTMQPATSPQTYQHVRAALHEKARDAGRAQSQPASNSGQHLLARSQGTPRAKTGANATSRALTGGDSAFARTLAPFFKPRPTTISTSRERSTLAGAVERLHAERAGSRWTVLLSSDVNRDDVRAAVRTARNGGDQVFVFLTPNVLFESDGLVDVEAAYERYAEFEQFRRELSRLGGVTAFEVGPGDRLQAILDARSDRASG